MFKLALPFPRVEMFYNTFSGLHFIAQISRENLMKNDRIKQLQALNKNLGNKIN